MRKIWIFAPLSLFLLAATAQAANRDFRILSHREERFENKDCEKNSTCSLKYVTLVVADYEIGVGDNYNYGTWFSAEYETDSIGAIEDYVFVQFMKGSLYSTSMKNGKLEIDYGKSVRHYDNMHLFKFPDWVVDTDNCDPVYSSGEERSRYHYLKWNPTHDLFGGWTYYGKTKPAEPRVYVADSPSSAFFHNGKAHNISLLFRTCIYKAKDVPAEIPTDKIDPSFAPSIVCFEWSSSFIYNHALGVFENRPGIADPSEK